MGLRFWGMKTGPMDGVEAMMPAAEIERYLKMEKPIGGPDGSPEWLDRQKWYYAKMTQEIEEIERGTLLVILRGEKSEAAKSEAIASRRWVLEQIAQYLRQT